MQADRSPSRPSAPDEAKVQTPEKPPLSPAAERALAEAAARRAERDRNAVTVPRESHGRNGLDPTRYNDWEVNGLTSDF